MYNNFHFSLKIDRISGISYLKFIVVPYKLMIKIDYEIFYFGFNFDRKSTNFIIIPYENMIKVDYEISYFGFNFYRKST